MVTQTTLPPVTLYSTLCARVNRPYLAWIYANYGGNVKNLPLKWALQDPLPAGLSLVVDPKVSAAASIQGTPLDGTQGKTYEFSVTVTDVHGNTAKQELYLYVAHDPAKP